MMRTAPGRRAGKTIARKPTAHPPRTQGGRRSDRMPPLSRANEFAATNTRSPPAWTGRLRGFGRCLPRGRLCGGYTTPFDCHSERGATPNSLLARSPWRRPRNPPSEPPGPMHVPNSRQPAADAQAPGDAARTLAAESAQADFANFQRRIHSRRVGTARNPPQVPHPPSAATHRYAPPPTPTATPERTRNPPAHAPSPNNRDESHPRSLYALSPSAIFPRFPRTGAARSGSARWFVRAPHSWQTQPS
jgi:hypothetical protein